MNVNHNVGTDFRAIGKGTCDFRISSLSDEKVLLRVHKPFRSHSYCKIRDGNGDTLYKVYNEVRHTYLVTDRSKENVILSCKAKLGFKTNIWVGQNCENSPDFIVTVINRKGSVTVSEERSGKTVATLNKEILCACMYSQANMTLHVDEGYNAPIMILLMINILRRQRLEKSRA